MGYYEPAGKSPLSDGTAFAENNDYLAEDKNCLKDIKENLLD